MTGAQDLLERPAQSSHEPYSEHVCGNSSINSSKAPEEGVNFTIWHHIAHYSPCTCEFVGSMVLALMWNCTSFDLAGPWKPLCMGLSLMVMTYCFASISGAEFNPAVTLSVGFAGKGEWRGIVRHWVAQFLGCTLGVGLSVVMFGHSLQERLGPRPPLNSGANMIFAVETVYTFMLCFVYLNCLYSRARNPVQCGNQFFGMAMGFALLAGGYAAQEVSGAVFNPAIATVASVMQGSGFLSYIGAQILGAFLAGLIFRIVRPDENDSYNVWLKDEAREHQMGITKLKAFSEAVGTWLFVFTMCMTNVSKGFRTAQPLAGGAIYICMNYALADCSGGYFNPAVTLSVMMSCRKRCSFVQGVCYIVVQLISATVAAFACTHVTHKALLSLHSEPFGTPQICVAELILMNITCLAILTSGTVKGIQAHTPHNFYHGLVYGLAYAAGGFATYRLTHGVLNPAVSIGAGLANHLHSKIPDGVDDLFLRKCLSMACFEFGGAIFAVCIFRITHARLYRKEELESVDDDCEAKREEQPLTLSKALPTYGVGAARAFIGS